MKTEPIHQSTASLREQNITLLGMDQLFYRRMYKLLTMQYIENFSNKPINYVLMLNNNS